MSNTNEISTEINTIIHQPARLQIMTHLFVVEEADILFLKRKTALTWGNLSSHMTKLEEAGYILVIKEIKDKKTHTTLKLTKKGRVAFEEYRQNIQTLLDSSRRS
ncbi:MAG: transcriptional regulator [Candidatus Kariarchaeaceae archaeon]|jgi:DNA-binding MarR family transcriptional regulator